MVTQRETCYKVTFTTSKPKYKSTDANEAPRLAKRGRPSKKVKVKQPEDEYNKGKTIETVKAKKEILK
jgi:hypothetical protein